MSVGKRVKLSNGRRLVDDIIQVAAKLPMAALSGDFDSGLVASLRRQTRPKISWNVLYMKAYAIVCKNNPQLRQMFVRFPWDHLYQHDHNVCMMTIARMDQGEERLLFARFSRPDERSLVDLQQQYDYYRRAPIEEIKQFRHQIRFAKVPRLIRRFVWWTLFNVWPQKRASQMGTFGMSFSGHRGSYGSQHLGVNTTILGVDPVPRRGVSRILLTFDHRVIDGTPATRTLQELQRALTTQIRSELAQLIGVHPDTGEKLDPEPDGFEVESRARPAESSLIRDVA